MPRILTVEDHVFFSEALEHMLGRRLSEESGEVPAFRRAVTLGEGLMLAEEGGPFALAIVGRMGRVGRERSLESAVLGDAFSETREERYRPLVEGAKDHAIARPSTNPGRRLKKAGPRMSACTCARTAPASGPAASPRSPAA